MADETSGGGNYMDLMSRLDIDTVTPEQLARFESERLTEMGKRQFARMSPEEQKLMVCLDSLSYGDQLTLVSKLGPNFHDLENQMTTYQLIVKSKETT